MKPATTIEPILTQAGRCCLCGTAGPVSYFDYELKSDGGYLCRACAGCAKSADTVLNTLAHKNKIIFRRPES